MDAIVYTSETGHTAEYAKILGEKTGLPVYELSKSAKELPDNTEIIYLGWLFAFGIKGYKKAQKKYKISAVCAVGLCDTGTGISEVRKRNSLSEDLPLFTLQGGIDKTKLRGVNKFAIDMLTKFMKNSFMMLTNPISPSLQFFPVWKITPSPSTAAAKLIP